MTDETELLTDLQAQNIEPGKPFDGMRAGSFVDMYGRAVTFDAKDLAEYVTNTNAAIEATRTQGGEIVGLPIDAKNHDKGNAAGWIIWAELVGDVIRFTPRWTALGTELIGASLQRFFSPTVDMTNKTVTGGSLTNWPATRAKGKTLLRPIELAEGDANPMEEMMKQIMEMLTAIWEKLKGEQPEEKPEPTEQPAPEAEPEMAASLAQMQTQLVNMTAQFERKARVMEFAARVTSGNLPTKRGLNMSAGQLAEVLLSLPDEQAAKVQAMLENLVVVDFGEKGHSGKIELKQEVPALIKPYLVQWLAAGKTAEQFFAVNPELGKMGDFNLSEFTKE